LSCLFNILNTKKEQASRFSGSGSGSLGAQLKIIDQELLWAGLREGHKHQSS
jgi:hypothetical protein